MSKSNNFDSSFDYSELKQRFLYKLESLVQMHCNTIYYIIAFDAHTQGNLSFVFLICVPDDETSNFLKNGRNFNTALIEIIENTKSGNDIKFNISVEVESQETVDRTANGNWIRFLQKENGL